MTIRRISLAAGLVLAAVGCSNEDLFTPAVPQYAGGAMFQRYVAMGNSITAGFQSGGINDSTQQQSYVALVAAKMGSPFYYPSLTKPGCPPPIDSVFTATGVPPRVGGGTAATCFLRRPSIPPPPPPPAAPRLRPHRGHRPNPRTANSSPPSARAARARF